MLPPPRLRPPPPPRPPPRSLPPVVFRAFFVLNLTASPRRRLLRASSGSAKGDILAHHSNSSPNPRGYTTPFSFVLTAAFRFPPSNVTPCPPPHHPPLRRQHRHHRLRHHRRCCCSLSQRRRPAQTWLHGRKPLLRHGWFRIRRELSRRPIHAAEELPKRPSSAARSLALRLLGRLGQAGLCVDPCDLQACWSRGGTRCTPRIAPRWAIRLCS